MGSRLRALRNRQFPQALTQKQVSQALGLSGALVSSWESGAATPPEDRLAGYALLFCTERSLQGDKLIPLDEDALSQEEEFARERLFDELRALRNSVLDEPSEQDRETGALGGRFLYYADGQPVTILCTPLSSRQLGYTQQRAQAGELLPAVQYTTNENHPNFVRNLYNADIDALVELVGHVRAESPTAEVSWLTYDRVSSADQLTGHLILLGGVDESLGEVPIGGSTTVLEILRERLDTPVRMQWDPDGVEFDGEVQIPLDAENIPTTEPANAVTTESHRPKWVRGTDDDRNRRFHLGAPELTSDVAIVHRSRNPFNPGSTATRFGGMFSRGTYGAVRAFTDARFRGRNEQWVDSNVDPEDFWMLLRVSVIAGTTMTPDLGRSSTRIRYS
nr:helix-turn-helix transcriptional regulator [Kineosporia babensis]